MELGPLQKAWVAALRSGNYKQGIETLRTPDDEVPPNTQPAFCCLGVLGDIHPDTEWKDDVLCIGDSHIGTDAFLPGQQLANLRDECGKIEGKLLTRSYPELKENSYFFLVDINDALEWDFNEIADFIETEPDAIFTGPA